MSDKVMIPHLKKDAQIQLTLGSAFIKKLELVIPYLLQNKTKEEISKFQSVKSEEDMDDWMIHTSTVYTLVQAIMKEAEKADMIVYKELNTDLS